MSFCPACRSDYPADWKRCPKDEAALLQSDHVGKYKIDGLIGAGGMGAVYRALNPDTKSTVAIKLMHRSASAQDDARKRFQREAASIAALKTRHVVTIFDFGTDVDGTLYLVMELLRGHSLRHEIGTGGGAMEIGRINTILQGALRGLASAHRAGITHRDLKPDNIFLAETDDGEVPKILDFGIARASREQGLTQSGALMGTPAYMPPEQVAGQRDQIGPWTDVYAMGVILYEMLTGAVPFSAESVTEILRKVLAREFTPISELRPELPAPIQQVVERALANAHDERYPDADAMRQGWEAAYRTVDPHAPASPPVSDRKITVPPRPMTTPRNVALEDTQATDSAPIAVPRVPTVPAGGRPPGSGTGAGPGAGSQSIAPVVLGAGEGVRKPGRGRWVMLGAAVVVAGGLAVGIPRLLRKSKPNPVTHVGSDAGAGPLVVTPPGRADAAVVVAPPAGADAAVVVAPPDPPGMVKLAGGSFDFGPPAAQQKDITNALPRTPVTLAPFWLDAHELSRADWAAVDQAGGGALPAQADAARPDADDLPVRYLSWKQADAACRALGKRLPSEQEWEFAATRAAIDPAAAHMKKSKAVDRPAPVGSSPGDVAEGVFDLIGNVLEWTSGETKGQRIARGGSYNVSPQDAYYNPLYARYKFKPTDPDPEVGVRCARDATP